jgi:glycosyltransferase involved in cell wall biosynthesis
LRLPTGIDRERFGDIEPAAIAAWKKQLGLGEHMVVTYVGTMSLANHPVDLLLEAFARLNSRVHDARLLLVGGGADLGLLRDIAQELGIGAQCRFTGRVGPDEVRTLLSLSHVTVDPVHDDEVAQARWPLKIVESLAAGVPIVTGDVGDRREMLGQPKAGLAVAPGDPQALAEALEAVLTNPTLQSNLIEGCRSQATKYNLADLCARLLSFYAQV